MKNKQKTNKKLRIHTSNHWKFVVLCSQPLTECLVRFHLILLFFHLVFHLLHWLVLTHELEFVLMLSSMWSVQPTSSRAARTLGPFATASWSARTSAWAWRCRSSVCPVTLWSERPRSPVCTGSAGTGTTRCPDAKVRKPNRAVTGWFVWHCVFS